VRQDGALVGTPAFAGASGDYRGDEAAHVGVVVVVEDRVGAGADLFGAAQPIELADEFEERG